MRKVKINDNDYLIEEKNNQTYLNGSPIDFDIQQIDKNTYHIIIENKSIDILVLKFDPAEQKINLKIEDQDIECYLMDLKDKVVEFINKSDNSFKKTNSIISPMPGLIQKVLVTEGEKIKQGKPLVILNAMKMENVIKAPQEGIVEKIFIKEADQVEKGKVLIQF